VIAPQRGQRAGIVTAPLIGLSDMPERVSKYLRQTSGIGS
jgi:hypothetical protein